MKRHRTRPIVFLPAAAGIALASLLPADAADPSAFMMVPDMIASDTKPSRALPAISDEDVRREQAEIAALRELDELSAAMLREDDRVPEPA